MKMNFRAPYVPLPGLMLLMLVTVFALAGCGSKGSPAPVGVNPYETAGVDNPDAFRQMFESLKKAVANNEKAKAAESALYPIRVNAGKVTVEIKTKEEFVKQYDRIFTDRVRKALAAQDTDSLFVNAEGVMAGNGEVWFGATAESPQRYGIITVNAGSGR